MLERGWALEFAREWIESWNSHDLERILAHYTADFEMSSPLIVERLGGEDGILKGKTAARFRLKTARRRSRGRTVSERSRWLKYSLSP